MNSVDHKGTESGSISIEMALAVPLLVVFFLVIVGFGHALYVRFSMQDVVANGARSCALARMSPQACVTAVGGFVGSIGRVCAGGMQVAARRVRLTAFESLQGMQVTVTCRYAGVLALAPALRHRYRIALGDLQVTSVVPY